MTLIILLLPLFHKSMLFQHEENGTLFCTTSCSSNHTHHSSELLCVHNFVKNLFKTLNTQQFAVSKFPEAME